MTLTMAEDPSQALGGDRSRSPLSREYLTDCRESLTWLTASRIQLAFGRPARLLVVVRMNFTGAS